MIDLVARRRQAEHDLEIGDRAEQYFVDGADEFGK